MSGRNPRAIAQKWKNEIAENEKKLAPDRSSWSPIVITIGPQCAGKTHYVDKTFGLSAHCAMDDMPFTYEK